MFTLNELNLLLGVTWDESYDAKVYISFHEQDSGLSEEVSVHCGDFNWRFGITPVRTAHLSATMVFRATELRALFRKLKMGYCNVNVRLPLEFYREGVEVKSGPARGTKVSVIKKG